MIEFMFNMSEKGKRMSVKLRKRKLPSGKVQLVLDIYQAGSRRFESLGMFLNGDRFENRQTLTFAEEVRRKREMDIQADYYGVAASYNREEDFVGYMRKVMSEKRAAKTREVFRCALDHVINYVGEDRIPFKALSRGFFEGFKKYLLDRVSPNSAKTYLGKVQTVMNQAVRENMLPVNTAQGVRIRKVQSLPKFLTLEEVRALAKCPYRNEQVKAAFLFSCFTGLRWSDVGALTWDKVREGYLEFRQLKTGEQERIPLGEEAKRILAAQPHDGSDEVFHPPTLWVVNRNLKQWAKSAGVNKHISFHTARHTFATLSLSAGIDLYTTSKLLGHRSIQTTEIYAKVVDERKQKAVAQLPSL